CGRVGRILVCSDIDPGDTCPMRATDKTLVNGRKSVATETKTVDHRLVTREAKETRARIAGLRARRDRADLCKSKAEAQDGSCEFGIFVEACRKPDRIGKIEPDCGDGEAWMINSYAGKRHRSKGPDRPRMRPFRVEPK